MGPGGLTTWGGGWTAGLCSQSGLAPWARGRTTNLCSGCSWTAQEHGLIASGRNPGRMRGAGSGGGMGATLGASSCRKMSKSLVRYGEAAKAKTAS
jgi:hypothetical protein